MELDRAEVCKDERGDFQYDPRYQLVGESVSEFDLQQEYGIIQTLQQRGYHERYIDYG